MTFTAHAPGRVELLGNHTDYNEGRILSAAIDRGITVKGGPLPAGRISLHSAEMPGTVETDLAHLERSAQSPWADYLLGVVRAFLDEQFSLGGFSLEISSDLPSGAGLSSSAALEVATAMFLKKCFALDIDPLPLAKLCRRAENEFVGVQCGLLDQVSSLFGKSGHAIHLDCRAETVDTIPFPPQVALLITHSGVKHTLTGGEYNDRRAQCFEAAAKLGVPALRDITPAQLDAAKSTLPPLLWKRAAHIVGENDRVAKGIAYLRQGNAPAFGALMFQSHESSRLNFENSTPELDTLVAIAHGEPGLFGSRLTGGGFGGATISLVEQSRAVRIAENITRKYQAQTGHTPQTWLCHPADGAHLIS